MQLRRLNEDEEFTVYLSTDEHGRDANAMLAEPPSRVYCNG